jgi:hypothetical protein
MSLVSGLGFHKLCEWSFDPRYPINFDYNKLIDGDKVLVNFDYFLQFINELKKYNFIKKFILISHNSDKTFTNQHYDLIKDYIYRVYSINNKCNSDNVVTIPIAFQDYPQNHFKLIVEKSLLRNKIDREYLLYMNFSLDTNKIKRSECYNIFINRSWVITEKNITKDEFMNSILKSKYVLSPEGEGIDCHRIYESIICGTIPIIKKSNTEMDKFYSRLPVILINDWNEINETYLIDNYSHYKNIIDNWLLNNKGWLRSDYWIQKIHIITFGDEKYNNTKLRFKNEAVQSKFFNSIRLYSPTDFDDDFEHINFVKNNRRGYGYWIWKLYFVLKKLKEVQYNDIVVFADAGCSINKDGKKRLNEYLEKLNDSNDNDILCFQMIHLEYKYTKNDIFDFFKANDYVKNSGQFVGGVLFIRKTDRIINFLSYIYKINSTNYNFLDDTLGYTKNHPEFIDCRHDQSVFSVAMKQLYNNKVVIPEETWPYDNNWATVKHVPILAKRIRFC